jgi:ABC-type transporter Mla subunit MlaD
MATAARFSAGAGSLSGSRANAAQDAAIFRLVASSNGLTIPLDYNTPAIDEMTNNLVVPAKRLRASRDP